MKAHEISRSPLRRCDPWPFNFHHSRRAAVAILVYPNQEMQAHTRVRAPLLPGCAKALTARLPCSAVDVSEAATETDKASPRWPPLGGCSIMDERLAKARRKHKMDEAG